MNSSLSAWTPTDDLKNSRKKECFEMERHFYFHLVHRESGVYLVPWKKCEYFDTRPGNHVERDVSFSWGGTFFGYCLFINAVLDYNLAFLTITARACRVFSSLADPGYGPSNLKVKWPRAPNEDIWRCTWAHWLLLFYFLYIHTDIRGPSSVVLLQVFSFKLLKLLLTSFEGLMIEGAACAYALNNFVLV